MKALPLHLPAGSTRLGLAAILLVASATVFVATWPQFLSRIYPVPPSLLVTFMYIALAALAARALPLSRGVRLAVWTPAAAHLVLIAFASYSLFRLGHWPKYGMPDPEELSVSVLYFAAMLSMLVGTLAVPFAAFTLGAAFWGEGWRRERAATWLHAVAVLAFGAGLWVFEWSDRRLFNWLMD